MKENIKKYLYVAIAFVSGILVTLGSVIFQNYSFIEQILIFKFFLLILIVLVGILVLFFIYSKFNMIKWKIKSRYKDMIGIEGRIKKEIKQLKRGKKGSYISVADIEEIIKNKKKYEKIDGFDILWDHIMEFIKNMGTATLHDFNFKLDI